MSDPVAGTPIAKVYGRPLLEVPQDLYIPPDALEVFLDQFEGPLDLLLYLIRKEDINVLDIPMARLTEQYLEYVGMMRAHQLELAAEYLLMAAMLIEIKSRLLLPRPTSAGEGEQDPRAELVRRLLEYEQMKLAAHKLNELPQAGRDFALIQVLFERAATERLPEVALEDLRMAWLGLLNRAAVNRHHKVTREQLSVRAHMSRILRRLQDRKFVEFAELFAPEEGVAVLVVTFLAILELVRETLVEVSQHQAYAPIYVKLRSGHLAAAE
ncbi:MAG: segregation and condensation protein A [Betaproteobacteria bacterium RIFCSPLOWO2_12_FULL_62_13]|nr:MAG: segregation and condensation protein A [Betaproteobacteria bacterium RIFCSPLOWO2_12_FULL_62_13]